MPQPIPTIDDVLKQAAQCQKWSDEVSELGKASARLQQELTTAANRLQQTQTKLDDDIAKLRAMVAAMQP